MTEGYTKTGRKLPSIPCCQCGKFLRYGAWNQHPVPVWPDDCCEHCLPLVARKEKAMSIARARIVKRQLSKLGKRMVDHNERVTQKEIDEGGLHSYRRAWTPLRYVSKDELSMMRSRRRRMLYDREVDAWVRWGEPVDIIVHSPLPRTDSFVCEPGFYRVDPVDEKRERACNYTRDFSGGMPTSYQNSSFDKTYSEREDDWKKKNAGLWKYNEAKRNREELARASAIKEQMLSKRKRHIQDGTPSPASRQFFATLGMAAAVNSKG